MRNGKPRIAERQFTVEMIRLTFFKLRTDQVHPTQEEMNASLTLELKVNVRKQLYCPRTLCVGSLAASHAVMPPSMHTAFGHVSAR